MLLQRMIVMSTQNYDWNVGKLICKTSDVCKSGVCVLFLIEVDENSWRDFEIDPDHYIFTLYILKKIKYTFTVFKFK